MTNHATKNDPLPAGRAGRLYQDREFSAAGLDLSSYDFEDPDREATADSTTDRDDRRAALLDLIKGRVLTAGVGQSNQEEHAALRQLARMAPRPVLAHEYRLRREDRAADWRPTEATKRHPTAL
ncbi:hypothetical protein CYMTET_20142 [Cymbomonas tetramitiformis]|uniref:Uncharacterized protein n=1 Tax=Cymbomonas tetramitiformis TaxID=36881 RepID=A0AAE0L470_9CHLO|nr:hypothetical protein CYMTET_20142 [Cymbomonas tetramitiformis]